jgi:hypothetical protein
MKADLLVAARATAKYTARDSTFDKCCKRCTERVMIAPSGQRFLKDRPGFEIICTQCFFETANPEDRIQLASSAETVLQEIAGMVPNHFRRRN